MNAFELKKVYKRANFPSKLTLFRELDAFPTQMIEHLNHARNLMEHTYSDIQLNKVVQFTEIAEMFLLLTYPYFKCIAIGAYVGVEGDDRCFEWTLGKNKVSIFEVDAPVFVDCSLGRVHYNVEFDNRRTLVEEVKITKANLKNWLPYLDFFMYCTKKTAVKLPQPDKRGHGVYKAQHTIHY